MHVCALCESLMPTETRNGINVPGTGRTYASELPCACWKLNPGPLAEQPVVFTAKPSLQT